MSLNATTLSAAIDNKATSFGVASATGIVNPVYAANPLITLAQNQSWLLVENELMFVTAVSGTVVSVLRGQAGTVAAAHASSTPVTVGLASDFSPFRPAISAFGQATPVPNAGTSAPATGATITPQGALIHFTGTTALVTINVPAGLVTGSKVTIVFDGSSSGLTWTAAGNINVAGTSTTAGSSVDFVYDESVQKWIPSRLA